MSELLQTIPLGAEAAFPKAEFDGRVSRLQEVLAERDLDLNRYHCALFRTVAVGEVSRLARDQYAVCLEAFEAALDKARPGATCADVHNAVQATIDRAGCTEGFRKRAGYSMGVSFAPDWGEGNIRGVPFHSEPSDGTSDRRGSINPGAEGHGRVSGPFRLLALGGDHIGPEVTDAALRVLRHMAARERIAIEIDEDLLGGASWDVHGTFCTDDVLEKARQADAVLLGAVGGPEWDGIRIDGPITETDGLTRLRIELDVYNALRPVRAWTPLLDRTPFRPEIVDGVDLLVVRENSGGIYYGEPRGRETLGKGEERAFEISEYRTGEIERIARCAFAAARSRRGRLASLDKSNVMETGKLWRETVSRVGRDEYPDVELAHLLMDYALYAVASRPRSFDVILADNLFGDLISDMVGAVSGSLGMLPSATLPGPAASGDRIRGGVFEPVHGSAPDIAGKGIANPVGAILSLAMMFDYALGRTDLAGRVEHAVEDVLASGLRTPDIGGSAGTDAVTDSIIAVL